MDSPAKAGHWWRWWFVGYMVLVGTVLGSMYYLRQSSIADLSSSESISEWQSWREDVRHQQANGGPVTRRIPKSDEPPALVLMRDYFMVLLVGALLFSSVLYWVMAWFLTGIFSTPASS